MCAALLPMPTRRGWLGKNRCADMLGEVAQRLAIIQAARVGAGQNNRALRRFDAGEDGRDGRGFGGAKTTRNLQKGSAVGSAHRCNRRRGQKLSGHKIRAICRDFDRLQWFCKWDIQVHRTRGGVCKRPAGDAAQIGKFWGACFGLCELVKPADAIAVEFVLVHRLRGAAILQLRRSIGAQNNQRNTGLARLTDRREIVGRGGAGRANQRHGSPGRLGQTEGKKRRRALVDDRVITNSGVLKRLHNQRCRARPWRDADIAKPAARQLIDERARPERIDIGRQGGGGFSGGVHPKTVAVRALKSGSNLARVSAHSSSISLSRVMPAPAKSSAWVSPARAQRRATSNSPFPKRSIQPKVPAYRPRSKPSYSAMSSRARSRGVPQTAGVGWSASTTSAMPTSDFRVPETSLKRCVTLARRLSCGVGSALILLQ